MTLSRQSRVLWLAFLLGTATVLSAAENENNLPLPQWSPTEWQSLTDPSAGPHVDLGALLPSDNLQLETPDGVDASFLNAGPKLGDNPPSLLSESSAGLRLDQMGLFLPDTLLSLHPSKDTPPPPTPASSLREVPAEFLRLAAGDLQHQRVADPQSLISEVPREDLLRLLEFHARECSLPIKIVLLDRAQKLPAQFDTSSLLPPSSGSAALCLVIYPVGEPWRARAFVSPVIQSQVSGSYLADMMDDCIKDSMHVSDADGQLDRFAVRLSTRLFWLEKLLDPSTIKSAKAAPHPIKATLHEVATSPDSIINPVSLLGALSVWPLIASFGTLGVLILGGFVGIIIWWRSTHHRPVLTTAWTLPEPTAVPRLGGAFCGGTGSMMKYAE